MAAVSAFPRRGIFFYRPGQTAATTYPIVITDNVLEGHAPIGPANSSGAWGIGWAIIDAGGFGGDVDVVKRNQVSGAFAGLDLPGLQGILVLRRRTFPDRQLHRHSEKRRRADPRCPSQRHRRLQVSGCGRGLSGAAFRRDDPEPLTWKHHLHPVGRLWRPGGDHAGDLGGKLLTMGNIADREPRT